MRRRLIMRARNSAILRRLVQRLFATDTSGSVPTDVAAGRVLGGLGVESLPVVLVIVIGADKATVMDVVDETARLQLLTAGFRPVIVSDAEALSEIRQYGYPVELLISRAEWIGPGPWDDYASERIAMLFAAYRANASITVGPGGLNDASRTVLTSLGPPSHGVGSDAESSNLAE